MRYSDDGYIALGAPLSNVLKLFICEVLYFMEFKFEANIIKNRRSDNRSYNLIDLIFITTLLY